MQSKTKESEKSIDLQIQQPFDYSCNPKGDCNGIERSWLCQNYSKHQNCSEKKASITVKAGTPIRNIQINDTATEKWTSANFEIINVNGVLKKRYPTYEVKLSPYEGKFHVPQTRTLILSANLTPGNATSKTLKWTANKSSKYVSLVPKGSSCIVYLRRVRTYDDYDIKITATTTDGSNKKTSTTIRVLLPSTGPCIIPETPAPTQVPTTETKGTG